MRSRWDALHTGLVLSIRSVKSARLFARLREPDAVLAPYSSGAAILAKLEEPNDAVATMIEKNRLLGALVECASDVVAGTAATELLLVGLWPGLSAAFTRLLYLYRDRPSDLAA